MFKVGDKVKIKKDRSIDSKRYDGTIQTITKVYENYCHVDNRPSGGIWFDEMELVQETITKPLIKKSAAEEWGF